MSHYYVAVFHRPDQSVDELLAPYDESIEVEPYIRFTKDEAVAYAKEAWRADLVEGKTDEELYALMCKGRQMDENGNILSTYNLNAKWDWFSEIDDFDVHDTDAMREYDYFFPTYAIVTPDGVWHAPGRVGWFGCSSESEEEMREWIRNYKGFFDNADPDLIVTLVDCHI